VPPKDDIAKTLAEAHRAVEPSITRIIRIITETEDETREPIKLLEVNPATSPSGIFPIGFTADPPRIPYPSVVIEVTESEYEQIRSNKLSLPEGWRLGETLYDTAA